MGYRYNQFRNWVKRNDTIIGGFSTTIKMFIFFSFVLTAVVMYYLKRPMIANDILIVGVLFIVLNKLDNLSR